MLLVPLRLLSLLQRNSLRYVGSDIGAGWACAACSGRSSSRSAGPAGRNARDPDSTACSTVSGTDGTTQGAGGSTCTASGSALRRRPPAGAGAVSTWATQERGVCDRRMASVQRRSRSRNIPATLATELRCTAGCNRRTSYLWSACTGPSGRSPRGRSGRLASRRSGSMNCGSGWRLGRRCCEGCVCCDGRGTHWNTVYWRFRRRICNDCVIFAR